MESVNTSAVLLDRGMSGHKAPVSILLNYKDWFSEAKCPAAVHHAKIDGCLEEKTDLVN